jgi:hypothetical protein
MADYYRCENKKPTAVQKTTKTSTSFGKTIAFYFVSIIIVGFIVVLFLIVYDNKIADFIGIGGIVNNEKYRTLMLGSIIFSIIFIIIFVSFMYIVPIAPKKRK